MPSLPAVGISKPWPGAGPSQHQIIRTWPPHSFGSLVTATKMGMSATSVSMLPGCLKVIENLQDMFK